MPPPSYPKGLERNKSLDILFKAEQGRYGILAQVCYDANSVTALVRAAERSKSPAMILLFPVTLAYGRGPFLRLCLDSARNASVPVSVHLDHATDPEHLELALSLAEQGTKFDSIMVDASHSDTDEENIAFARPYVERALKCGIAVEVELGRLEGGEAGLRMMTDAKLTEPENAAAFIEGTGACILAPSIGNLHGSYINPPNFRQDILQSLHDKFKAKVPLCLHGTDELPDELFKECIRNGVSKINVNSWARDPYTKHIASCLSKSKSLPDTIEEATEVFACVCERLMRVFGSAGKA